MLRRVLAFVAVVTTALLVSFSNAPISSQAVSNPATTAADAQASISTESSSGNKPKTPSGPTVPPCGKKKVPFGNVDALVEALGMYPAVVDDAGNVTFSAEYRFFANGPYLVLVVGDKTLTWGYDSCAKKEGYFDFGDKVPVDAVLASLTKKVIEITDKKFLDDPASAINPAFHAPTQLGLWLSVDANSQIEANATAGANLWRRMVVSLASVTWEMGNGDRVVCSGLGTPYDEAHPTKEQSPDCGYTYRSKQDARASDLTIRAVLRYERKLTGTGLPVPVEYPDVCRTLVIPYDVYELQTVPTGSPKVTLPEVAAPYAIVDRTCPSG